LGFRAALVRMGDRVSHSCHRQRFLSLHLREQTMNDKTFTAIILSVTAVLGFAIGLIAGKHDDKPLGPQPTPVARLPLRMQTFNVGDIECVYVFVTESKTGSFFCNQKPSQEGQHELLERPTSQ
jgi:hypothetical protein